MSERDELADLIADHVELQYGDVTGFYDGADAILAAGYRRPAVITTAAELAALPVGSVILADTYDFAAWKKDADGWWQGTNRDVCPAMAELLRIYGPTFTVLHRGQG